VIIKLLFVCIVLAMVLVSISLWGGCELGYKLDSAWCSVRYLFSEEREFACRVTAVFEKAGCLGANNSGLDL
jgi:hypothetical protein